MAINIPDGVGTKEGTVNWLNYKPPLGQYAFWSPEEKERHRAFAKAAKTPVIYFIQASTGHIKIGTATDIKERLSNLQAGNPMPLKILAVVPGTRREEKALHAEFAGHRAAGEWFNPAPELMARIDALLGK